MWFKLTVIIFLSLQLSKDLKNDNAVAHAIKTSVADCVGCGALLCGKCPAKISKVVICESMCSMNVSSKKMFICEIIILNRVFNKFTPIICQ